MTFLRYNYEHWFIINFEGIKKCRDHFVIED